MQNSLELICSTQLQSKMQELGTALKLNWLTKLEDSYQHISSIPGRRLTCTNAIYCLTKEQHVIFPKHIRLRRKRNRHRSHLFFFNLTISSLQVSCWQVQKTIIIIIIITNSCLSDNHWIQASLANHENGLGIRCESSLAYSAFLASATNMLDLQESMLIACNVEVDTKVASAQNT